MLDVVVPWYPGGETWQPTVIPYVSLYQSGGLWRVDPSSFFARTNPAALVYIPSSSQFHDKAEEHEQVHYDQYAAGGSYHLLEDLWNPTAARNAIINLTHTTEQGLWDLVDAAVYSYLQDQADIDQARRDDAEEEAYDVSDEIAPRYIYQDGCL